MEFDLKTILNFLDKNPTIRDFVANQMGSTPTDPVAPAIRYKQTVPNAVAPYYATPGSVGFDLSTAEEVILQPCSVARVTTGLVIATPPDHYLRITGRSSTPTKYGIMVIEGVIDQDYSGDDDVLKLQVWNFTEKRQRIPLQSRIAQGIFIPVTRGQFVHTTKMGESRGGFGSTG
jgi:dUTP pyrophosphatase